MSPDSISMFLERLEIHGFKSFAKKTVLEFLPPRGGKMGITAIVGPNGSGKSNYADAVRWVLGEQSMKTLRGKKSEDVIFSGSDAAARLGMAEVSLKLNNADGQTPLDMSEVLITRRLYRDGESEYLVNGAAARLSDIALLLARARFGQKFYTVIGQGLVDSILLATPSERKEFFDEAAGVKEFQIKRTQALNKLERTRENLAQAEALLNEIEPRLRSLNRARRRLEERQTVESELRGLQSSYYGALWQDLSRRLNLLQSDQAKISAALKKEQAGYDAELRSLSSLEKEATASQALIDFQRQYQSLMTERQKLQEENWRLKNQLTATSTMSASALPAAPAAEILEAICEEEEEILKAPLPVILKKLFSRLRDLLAKLRPASAQGQVDAKTTKQLDELKQKLAELDKQVSVLNQKTRSVNEIESQSKSQFFDLQRRLQKRQNVVHEQEQRLNNVNIELARYETRRDNLANEINLEMGPLASAVKEKPAGGALDPAALQPQIFKLKHQLELIGGIDLEAMKEYDEIRERHDFLSSQIADLNKGLADTGQAVIELDRQMKDQREAALKNINREFDHFFKMVFNGGSAKLVFIYGEDLPEVSEEESQEEEKSTTGPASLKASRGDEHALIGIDIQATPPGKRIRDINILSGGERALTAVVLICAILYNSPSPFVVLDEVDAALDESNSLRFAEILAELSSRTQFIIITHNRATMSKAQLLYGVTMGTDGISRLLSVNLEEAEQMANR